MITHKAVEEYLLSMPNAWLDYPFGKEAAVYKFIPTESIGSEVNPYAPDSGRINPDASGEGRCKMFALIAEKSKPVRLSLKCDPQLAEVLRNKYESVMPGYHLNKKHWNTIVLSGQLPWEEVQGLIRHSYDLVAGNKNATPEA